MEISQMNDAAARSARLHALARRYVTEALGKKDFDAIPYADDVTLRVPISPGGSANAIVGRENARTDWWTPLPGLIGEVEVLDTYVNQDLSGVAVEFLCGIINPPCTLRVVDRFKVNADGKIVEQENFFDPRDVTNPGWQDA